MEIIVSNRKARHDYFVLEKYEAGICLLGSEVKSIREGRVNLKDSFVRVVRGEAFLVNCHITLYSRIQGYSDVDPIRTRKLLLNRSEINRLAAQSNQKGHTIVPLSLYFKKGKVKAEIAVAIGKKEYDKRETIRKKMQVREAQSAIKHFKKNKGGFNG